MAKSYSVTFGSGDPRGFTGLAPTFLSFWNLATGTTNAPPSIAETVSGKTGIYSFTYGVTQPISFLLDAATTSPGPSGRYVVGQIDPVDRVDEMGTTMIAIGTTLIGYGNTSIALGTTSVAIGTTHLGQGVSLLALGSTILGYGFTNFGYGSTNYGYGVSLYAGLGNQGITVIGIGNTLLALGFSSGALEALIGDTTSSYGSTSSDPSTVFGFLKRSQEFWEGNQVYIKASGILDFYSRGSTTLLREKTIADTSSQTTKI